MKKRRLLLAIGLTVAAALCVFGGCASGGQPDDTTYALSATQLTLTVGESRTLTISPQPDKTVTWDSDNDGIATVESGTVTAVAEGTAKITAAIEGVEAPLTCSVTVNADISGGGYALTVSSAALKTGETIQLGVVDGENNPVSDVEWSSDNGEVATVNETGLVTAVGVGQTAVKAQIGEETLTCSVTVAQGYTYRLEPETLSVAVGGTGRITLVTTPEAPDNARPHTFTSDNGSIAEVEGGTGKVTGVAKGTTNIVCSVDGQTLTASVTVIEYAVKLGEEALPESLDLRVGDMAKTVTVTADPDVAIDAVYASADPSVVTFTGSGAAATLTVVGAGSTSITVTVGGRTWRTSVVVGAQVQYKLQAGGTEVEDGGTATVKLGETLTLAVMQDPPTTLPTVTFDAEEQEIATVSSSVNGTATVTPVKIGSTSITVGIADSDSPAEFTITVNVILGSELEAVEIPAGSAGYNLTYLDENKTIDWYKFNTQGQSGTGRMKNNSGVFTTENGFAMQNCDDEPFYDYKSPVFYDDMDGEKPFGGNTYGRAVHGSFNVGVKLTGNVTKILLFTGAWKEKATVSFVIDGVIMKSVEFEAVGEASIARLIVFTPEMEGVEGELNLTIQVTCNRSHGGNASIVAVAAIGKAPHEARTAQSETTFVKNLSGELDLTADGTLDWVAVKDGNSVYRKASTPENIVIKVNEIAYDNGSGNFGTDFGVDDGNTAHFTWTDGTSAAPEALKNFKHADNYVIMPIALTAGKFSVTLYLTGWNSTYLIAVYDANGALLENVPIVTERTGKGVTAKVSVSLDAKTAGTYTFKLLKTRESNVGWAAITVSQETEYALETSVFDLAVGGTGEHKIVVKQGDSAVSESVSYQSSESGVVQVDGATGKLTAIGPGTAYITVTVNGVKLYARVDSTEYSLNVSEALTLSVEKTLQITVTADPQRDVKATYAVTKGENDVVTVTEDGLITAKGVGDATVTVTVQDKTFTIEVKVVTYTLSENTLTFTLGEDPTSHTLTVKSGEEDVDGVTFTSEDSEIVTVEEGTGLVTPKGIGKTTIKAVKDGVTLECTVIVKLKVETSDTVDYPDGSGVTVNLDELDDTDATLDWHFFRDDTVHRMAGGDLIGELSNEKTDKFGDYRTHITWYNGGEAEKASMFGYTDGWTFGEGVSFTVKVTKDVKYISVFTGAWHAKNTVTISYDGEEYAKLEFTNNGKGGNYNDGNDAVDKNKQVIFTPDMTHFGEKEHTFTITITCGDNLNGWSDNVSLVAIAVVGNTPRAAHTKATGSESHELTSNGEAVDLTAVGTTDWAYICDAGNGLVTKNVGSHVIGGINCIGGQGSGNDGFAKQTFTWSDGTKDTSGTDKFKWCDNVQAICVTLEKSATVTLWISAWKESVDLTVYDRGEEVIAKTEVITGDGSDNSQGVKITVTLNVTDASTFTFLMKKSTSYGGNFGLGAIAVADANA